MLLKTGMTSINAVSTGMLQPVFAPQFPRLAERHEPARVGRGVMVCFSSSQSPSRFQKLLARGLRLAEERNGPLYLVHVETLSESFRGAAKERLRELLECAVAAHANAEVVWLKALDPVRAILDCARERRAGRILAGWGRPRTRVLGRSVFQKLIAEARDVSIEILGHETKAEREMRGTL